MELARYRLLLNLEKRVNRFIYQEEESEERGEERSEELRLREINTLQNISGLFSSR